MPSLRTVIASTVAGVAAAKAAADARQRRTARVAEEAVIDDAVAACLAAHASTAPPDDPWIAVCIAGLNEGPTIRRVIEKIPDDIDGTPVEVIVTDDGSTDDTAAEATGAGAVVARHERNLGQGAGLRTAFAVALGRGASVIVTMDADGQHRPDELPDLVRPVLAGDADYVQGSRFAGRYDDAGGAREAGIRLFNVMIEVVGRTRISDCTNGYRAIRASELARFTLHENKFSAPELIMEAATLGLRMHEIPVHIASREVGESRKPRRLGYPLGFARVILQVRARHLFG